MICIACGEVIHGYVVDAIGGLHPTCARDLKDVLEVELERILDRGSHPG